MEHEACPRHLRIERKIGPESVFPIGHEAEEAEIEFFRLRLIEDAQDWCRFGEDRAGLACRDLRRQDVPVAAIKLRGDQFQRIAVCDVDIPLGKRLAQRLCHRLGIQMGTHGQSSTSDERNTRARIAGTLVLG